MLSAANSVRAIKDVSMIFARLLLFRVLVCVSLCSPSHILDSAHVLIVITPPVAILPSPRIPLSFISNQCPSLKNVANDTTSLYRFRWRSNRSFSLL
jgi:hypothetical protein